jgi:hypothetical protein
VFKKPRSPSHFHFYYSFFLVVLVVLVVARVALLPVVLHVALLGLLVLRDLGAFSPHKLERGVSERLVFVDVK